MEGATHYRLQIKGKKGGSFFSSGFRPIHWLEFDLTALKKAGYTPIACLKLKNKNDREANYTDTDVKS